MSVLDLKLSPNHDIDTYALNYAKHGMVRIENLFPDEIAHAIYEALEKSTPWHVVHSNENGMHKYYTPEVWNGIPNHERQRTVTDVMKRAKDGFAYYYLYYPMIRAYVESKDPGWPLHAMTEFLNSHEMLSFVKSITAEPNAEKLNAQATFYARGHFLNTHDDTGHDSNRLAAYVMGFSQNWRADWGGHLLFLDEDKVQTGFAPSFNSLTLFKVPRQHIVTQVTNFAGAGRYSITGWLVKDS